MCSKDELFYTLPPQNIFKIVSDGASLIGDKVKKDTLCRIIQIMSKKNANDASSLLNYISMKDSSLNECLQLIASLQCSPVCKQIAELTNTTVPVFEIEKKKEKKIVTQCNNE